MADNKTPTPGNPGTYLPIPGQQTFSDPSNKDAQNAAQIKSRNTVPGESASSFNDARQQIGANDGKIYAGPTTPLGESAPQRAAEFTDTATLAKGPKGDKGDKGDVGPRGPAGPQGPKGDGEPIDYDLIRQMIIDEIAKQMNFKNLKFKDPVPASVFATKSISLPVELYDTLTQVGTVVTPTYQLGLSNVGTINASGLFTAADIATQQVLTVTANYTDSGGKNYTVSTNVTIRPLVISALSVTGPGSINSAGTGTYAATVTYTDGTTKVVTNDATWSIASGTIGTLNKNILTAPVVTSNASGVVRASFTEKGITVTGNANVSIVAPQLKPFYGAAAHPVTSNTADPALYDGWGAFVQALSGVANNASKNNTFTTTQAVGQYGWYAYPKSFGIMTEAQIKGNGQPGPGGWDYAKAPNDRNTTTWNKGGGPLEITVTINGSDVPFYLYRTANKVASGTFTETWVVSN